MAYPKSQLDAMNSISPELTTAMQNRPFPQPPPSPDLDFRAFRASHLRQLRHLMPVPGPIPSQIREEEHLVPVRDGHNIRVVSYRPTQPETPPGPLIVLFHEGAWSMGDLTDEEFNARLFTRDLGATCLNVEYRLAPEHKFPVWINDAWDVVQWAANSTADGTLHTDPSKGFIVGGSSAGGNISAVLAHMARDRGLQPPITGQWLACAYLIPSKRVPDKYREMFVSMTEGTNDPVLQLYPELAPERWLDYMLGVDVDSALFSVVAEEVYPPRFEVENKMKDPLARAYFQIAGLDPFRDHSLIYDRILREEYGVDTKIDIYPGFGHMFWTNWPEMETSRRFADDLLKGMKWLLSDTHELTGV